MPPTPSCAVAVFLNGDAIAEPDPYGDPVVFRLPDATYGERWTARIDTADPQGLPGESERKADTDVRVEARSLVLLSRPHRPAAQR